MCGVVWPRQLESSRRQAGCPSRCGAEHFVLDKQYFLLLHEVQCLLISLKKVEISVRRVSVRMSCLGHYTALNCFLGGKMGRQNPVAPATGTAAQTNGNAYSSKASKDFSIARYLNLSSEQQETYLKLLILTVSCIMCE